MTLVLLLPLIPLSLLKYAQGNTSWDEVKSDVVKDWEKEANASKS